MFSSINTFRATEYIYVLYNLFVSKSLKTGLHALQSKESREEDMGGFTQFFSVPPCNSGLASDVTITSVMLQLDAETSRCTYTYRIRESD
jgi:hypothetical protein